MRTITVITVVLLMFVSSALAFEPEGGSRAYPIAGEDMISHKQFDLEAYRGKWVFLEFWASW